MIFFNIFFYLAPRVPWDIKFFNYLNNYKSYLKFIELFLWKKT